MAAVSRARIIKCGEINLHFVFCLVREITTVKIAELLQTSESEKNIFFTHRISFHEVSQLVEKVSSHGGVHGPPGAAKAEGIGGGLDSLVHISLVTLLHFCDDLASCRIEGLKGFARNTGVKFIVDKNPRVLKTTESC